MSKIENIRIDLDKHQEYPGNYNEHPEAQILELMESLRQFGQPKNVVVWHDKIVAGNGIAKAALRLGWKQLDARRLPSDWPEYKVLAYLGADNELARGASSNLQALASLAAEVRKEDETLARLAAGGREALAELQALAQQTALGDGDVGAPKQRSLGPTSHQVKVVVNITEIRNLERALRATGNQNRGEALLDVCRFYLEHHGEDDAERQHDAATESGLAALAAIGVD